MPMLATAAAAAVAALGAATQCYELAAERYRLPVSLLYAITEQESSYRPDAVAYADNGTHSVGLMQINSSWFETLEALGISESDLYLPCVNVQVGAWILAQEVSRYGHTWEAIGAYYAGPYTEQNKSWKMPHYQTYARQVFQRWQRLLGEDVEGKPAPVIRARASKPQPVYTSALGRLDTKEIAADE